MTGAREVRGFFVPDCDTEKAEQAPERGFSSAGRWAGFGARKALLRPPDIASCFLRPPTPFRVGGLVGGHV
jgi:hypothetical protein